MSEYSDATSNSMDLVQKVVDTQRKNAAYHALAQVYGPTAGDPELAAKLQNNAFNAQDQPLRVQAQQLSNTGAGLDNTQKQGDQQRMAVLRGVGMLKASADPTTGAIPPNAFDQIVAPNAQLLGLDPQTLPQVKSLLTQPGGAQHLDQISQSILGPTQISGQMLAATGADGQPMLLGHDKYGRVISESTNGAVPTTLANSQSSIANRNSQMINRPLLPNGQVNQPFVDAKTRIAAAAAKAGVSLSDDAINMLADEGIKTGKLQTFGMGGGKNTAAIANAMAAKGTTGDQLATGQQDYKSRQAYVTDLAKSSPTSAGGLSRSAGAVLAHIDTLDQMIDALGNKNVRLVNYLQQKYKQETGKPIPLTFDAQKTIVGDEIGRYLIARGGTQQDRQGFQDSLSRVNSPAQLRSVISTYKDDIGAQLYSQYSQAKGFNADKQFLGNLTPYAQEILTGVDDPRNHPTTAQMSGAQPKGQLPGGFTYLGAVKQ